MVHTIYTPDCVLYARRRPGGDAHVGASVLMFRSGGTIIVMRRPSCGQCCWSDRRLIVGPAGAFADDRWHLLLGTPGTIRLRPWKWVPLTSGDRRTWLMSAVSRLMISAAVPLFSPGVHSDSLSAAMPGNTSGLVNPALLIAPSCCW